MTDTNNCYLTPSDAIYLLKKIEPHYGNNDKIVLVEKLKLLANISEEKK